MAGSLAAVIDSALADASASPCAAMTAPVYESLGKSGTQLLTDSSTESASAAKSHGYTAAATPFHVALKPASGLVGVIRLAKPSANDYLYTTSKNEAASVVKKSGYTEDKIAFYAGQTSSTCDAAVYRYRKGGQHRYVLAAGRQALQTAKWIAEGVAWYAPVASAPPKSPLSSPTVAHPSSSSRPVPSSSAPSTASSSRPAPSSTSASSSRSASPTPPASSSSPPPNSGGSASPLNQQLYVTTKNRNDTAAYNASSSGSSTQRLLWQLANTQVAYWVGGASSDASTIDQMETAATAAHQTPTFVLYAIPHRDGCGAYSKGGMSSQSAYEAWVDSIHAAIAGRPAIVIIEPDAIGYGCLAAADQTERIAELQYDINKFATATNPNIVAYIHAGSSGINPTDMAAALQRVGVSKIRGFAVNISSFDSTASETAFGNSIDKAMGTNQPFVIDTGRNGDGRQPGSDSSCNPAVQATGTRPSTRTGIPNVDAFLWIHTSGGSDGQCHTGDPAAGTFVPAWAAKYVQSAIDQGIIKEYPVGTYATSS